jgi:hypothetical protein
LDGGAESFRLGGPSTPVPEELDLVPHTFGGDGGAKAQDAAQLLAN